MQRSQSCCRAAVALIGAAAIGTAALASPPAVSAPVTDDGVTTALLAALDDEYKAEAAYRAVLDRHGEVRPFSNIILAEQRHQEMVKAELDARGIGYASNPYFGKIAAPATLLEACRLGVQAEVDNVALYDKLLPTVTDPAARAVLERLQWASRENHLPAFQRCVTRGGTPGMGGGGGHGRGRGGGGGGGGGGGSGGGW